MTGLGLSGSGMPSGQIRVGFRSGWVRSVALTVGGVSLVGLAFGILGLAERQPAQILDLLSHWGFIWLLVLAAMLLLWDLAKLALGYLGKLSDSVQESAVAMARIADRDDRERDRMATETTYLSTRMEQQRTALGEMQQQLGQMRSEHRDFQSEVLKLLRGNHVKG